MKDTDVGKGPADIDSPLPRSAETFILHWGDLGNRWGVNRSVAQIQALLYISEAPLPAETIALRLGLARSNVSNSLKELLGWKLIARVPVKGDRRDHFVAETDLWRMLLCIAAGRKEREIDPVIAALGESVRQASHDPAMSGVGLKRLSNMLEFVNRISRWHDQMTSLPSGTLAKLITMGSRVAGLVAPAGVGKTRK